MESTRYIETGAEKPCHLHGGFEETWTAVAPRWWAYVPRIHWAILTALTWDCVEEYHEQPWFFWAFGDVMVWRCGNKRGW